jgi:hypothetical protein
MLVSPMCCVWPRDVVFRPQVLGLPHLQPLQGGNANRPALRALRNMCEHVSTASPPQARTTASCACLRSAWVSTGGAGWLGGVFSNKPVGGLPTNETTFATALRVRIPPLSNSAPVSSGD